MTALPVFDTLPNGVRLVHLPASVPYTAVGLWWQAGSRHEGANEHGYAHLMEHALFCGAGMQSAAMLDQAIDRLGGQVNGETGREWLGLYGIAPAAQQAELGELLADMALAPRLEPQALAAEKKALAGELAALAGDPLDVAASRALAMLWPDAAGRPTEGHPAVIDHADRGTVLQWWEVHCAGSRLTVTVIGPEAADDTLAARLNGFPTGEPVLTSGPPAGSGADPATERTIAAAWAFPIPFSTLPERCTARLAAALIGGSLSSPVTRRLREAGVYHHRCWIESIQGAAACVVTVAGNRPGQTGWVEAVDDTLHRLTHEGPSFSELETVRRRTLAGSALAATDPVGFGRSTADDLLALGHIPTDEAVRKALASTTTETLRQSLENWRHRVFAVADI